VSLDRALKVAASALSMQRARMEIISSNMANAQTTRTSEGGPYVRRLPTVHAVPVEKGPGFEDALSRAVKGVRVTSVAADPRPPLMKYEPGHPDANKDGYVAYPNVNPVEEMVDMLSAMRSYEAGTNVVKTVQRMNDTALSIIR
jgi:flagellar basal-body rod protein FlgC